MAKKWSAESPSNIALIKYMGKSDVENNRPSNSSLSWTLNHLLSMVTLEESQKSEDSWQPLESQYPLLMSETGRLKFLKHFERMKKHFEIKGFFKISSANNFPADCGIASSASSFAALTQVCSTAFSELSGKSISLQEQAYLSSLGSGSSCRSFLSPWVLWQGDQISLIKTQIPDLLHMVVLVSSEPKKVSSSQAHRLVSTSSLFRGRTERAETRLKEFINASTKLNWPELFQLAWQEFWDMHALFETSYPSFGYFKPESIKLLNQARKVWEQKGDGPLVTMDAGPNIHLLWRLDQRDLAHEFYQKEIKNKMSSLTNMAEIGFAPL